MGINDKDYANALEHQRLHERALMQLEYDKQIEEKKMAFGAAISSVMAPNQATITTASIYPANVAMTQSGSKVLNEQDLQHDAMKAPLSALIDMWTVRYSGEWVSEADFQEDDFWRLALIRLVGANKLEKHHLANQYAAVYRIIE